MIESKNPYNLSLEIRPRYLYARVESYKTSKAMVVNYLHEIVRMCSLIEEFLKM